MNKKDLEYEADKLIGQNIYEELTNNKKFNLKELESLTINYKNHKEKSIELIIKDGYCINVNVGKRKMDNISSIVEKLISGLCFVGDSVEVLLKYQPYSMIESIVLQYGNKKMTVKVERIIDLKAGDGDD